jgi:hypothetical protein
MIFLSWSILIASMLLSMIAVLWITDLIEKVWKL